MLKLLLRSNRLKIEHFQLIDLLEQTGRLGNQWDLFSYKSFDTILTFFQVLRFVIHQLIKCVLLRTFLDLGLAADPYGLEIFHQIFLLILLADTFLRVGICMIVTGWVFFKENKIYCY